MILLLLPHVGIRIPWELIYVEKYVKTAFLIVVVLKIMAIFNSLCLLKPLA